MLSDMYSKLDPNAPYEEKKKFYPVASIRGSLCPEGQFKDYDGKDSWPKNYYCFPIPQFPDYKNRAVIPITDELSELIGCHDHHLCFDSRRDIRSVCLKKTGFKYKSRVHKEVDGICVKSPDVAQVYTYIYDNLPANTPVGEKKKYLPASNGNEKEKTCKYEEEECGEGQFCGEIGTFVAEEDLFYEHLCYYNPKLPDANNEGPIILATELDNHRELPLCMDDSNCYCMEEICRDFNYKCFKNAGVKYAKRYDKLYNGICIRANPVAFVFSETYLNLSADVLYEDRRKYFPVDFVDSNELVAPKQCSTNKECADGQFCGTVYDYLRKRPKRDRKQNYEFVMHCFIIPQFSSPSNTQKIIAIVPDSTEMEVCSSTVRCKADEHWMCDTGIGLKFVKQNKNENKVVCDGICIKEHPVAYAFSEQYKNLAIDVVFEEKKKYFPTDYEGLSQNALLNKCSMNSQCADGQFCGAVYDSTDNAPKLDVYYCFAIPHFPDLNGLPRIVALVPTEKDLVLCDSDSDCNVWRCDLTTGQKFVEEKTKQVRNGICEKAPPVAYVFSEIYLNLSPDSTYDEKKKYFPEKYDNASDECTTHSNCDPNKFCGAILDFTTKLPKKRYYCFDLPQLPELNDGPRIAGKPATNNLALCNKNLDCASDELWKCDLESGLKFAEEVGGKREIFNGVCIKAPPVALVFSDTYLNLNTDVSYEGKRKFFAVDYVEPNQTSNLKTCSTNKDCDEGQFCDQVMDFTNNLAKEGRYHCFAVPTIDAPFHESTKITIQSDKSGLVLCNEPSDCGSELFCNVQTGQKYVKSKDGVKENVEFNGICMKADICKLNEHNEQFKWSYGTSPTNSKISCDSDVDCAGTRDTGDTIFQSSCVLNKAFHNVNLCCHRETQPCKLGKLVGAEVRCGKNELFKDGIFAECNGGLEKMGGQGDKADKWCDEGNNQCCQDPTDDKIQYCPDEQTPLFNEPKCSNYDENVPNSGKCIDKAGSICKNGHCCPDVKIDAQGQLVRNKHSYTTNHPCIPGIRPSQFPAGYCDPESGKVVILGELSPLNETLTRWPKDASKQCQKDSDCSSDNSTLCIYNEEPYCYYNPMRHVPTESSNVVIIIVIIIGIIIIVAVIAGVTVWMLKKKKIIMKPTGNNLESQSAQTPSKSLESKVSAESVSGMKTPTAKSVN